MYDNWEDLEQSIKDCKKCKLCTNRTNIVFGVGNKNADVMFIGEGPGADEDRLGEPFVGKAGKLMNKAFQALEIHRDKVYIANIVKCRPPQNRTPEADEAQACLNYLRNQVIPWLLATIHFTLYKLTNTTVYEELHNKQFSAAEASYDCGTTPHTSLTLLPFCFQRFSLLQSSYPLPSTYR